MKQSFNHVPLYMIFILLLFYVFYLLTVVDTAKEQFCYYTAHIL